MSYFRNRFWHLQWASSPNDTQDFIRNLVGEFSDETFADVSEMLSLESGWVFSCIVEYHIRLCTSIPDHFIRYAGRSKPEPFHPLLQRVFARNVIDPVQFLKVGYAKENLCVPMCVILACHAKFGPAISHGSSRNLTKFQAEMDTLNYQSIMRIERVGMTLTQVTSFEKALSPPPANLTKYFPALKFFHGLSINIYTVQRKDSLFRIFPTSISSMARRTDFFQIDLFIDSPELRKDNAAATPLHHHQNKSNVMHTLYVRNLPKLLNNFTARAVNRSHYEYLCRSCLTVFREPHLRSRHWEICGERKRGAVEKRRSQNALIHRPWKKNKWSGKFQRNGLFFPRKWVCRQLAPLAYVVFDYESYHEDVNVDQLKASSYEGPFQKSTQTLQVPMAYSHVMRSLYKEHALPRELSLPRVHFLNPHDSNPEGSFFTSLLLSMRDDLLAYHNWQMEILSYDQGPLPERYRTGQEMAAFISTSHCQLCGVPFNKKLWSAKNQCYYRVKKCYDHNHYLRNSKGCRAIICQGRYGKGKGRGRKDES